MGAKATFDVDARVIRLTEAPTNGIVSVDVVVDLYSDAKEDWLSTPSLQGVTFPFFPVGGNPLTPTADLQGYIFLRNDVGWRIEPYDDDHELTITGELYPADVSLPLFLPRTNRTIVTLIQRSSATQVADVSGGGFTDADRNTLDQTATDASTAASESALAKTAAQNADTSAQGAETAAQSADTSAQSANTAAQEAESAAQGAETAAQGADLSAQDAKTAAQSASSSADSANEEAIRILKHLANRMEVDVDNQELVLYDNDGTTIIQRWPLETDGGEDVVAPSGVQTKRKAPLL